MNISEILLNTPIAHRGLHRAGVPENSLAAFEAAAKSGYPVETDVRFTKDKQLVVFHDDTVDRMTDGTGEVSAFPLAALRELRLEGTAERIPLFSECLETVAGRVPLLLEIKDMPGVSGREIAEALLKEIANFPALSYAVQSFQPAYPTAFKKLRPDVACGMLGADKTYTKADFHGSPIWRVKAALLPRICIEEARLFELFLRELPLRKTCRLSQDEICVDGALRRGGGAPQALLRQHHLRGLLPVKSLRGCDLCGASAPFQTFDKRPRWVYNLF